MRSIKIASYLLACLLLQTVIFSRLNFFGVTPDIILLSVIILSVLEKRANALALAGIFGFFQDLLSFGIYLNALIKLVIALLVTNISEEYLGDNYQLALGMVALFTPVALLLEWGITGFLFHAHYNMLSQLFHLIGVTIYNLVLFPFFYLLIKDGLVNE
jgi:rod shape-determining protein MreD